MIVEVVPYDPNWKKAYEKEKEALVDNLGELIYKIHHIGSTSIKGLAAKPIIDILLEVQSLTTLDNASSAFQSLGYEIMGEFGIKGRRYYRKGDANRTHQVHAYEAGDANVKRHIAFRDYLVANPAVMHKYEKLKIRLANEYGNDIERYCDGKDSFVKYHEARALQWISST